MGEQRDYSDVVWPWDGDPNWAAPREGATYDVSDEANWKIACGECELQFPKDIELHVVADHWKNLHHPDWSMEHQEPQLVVNLVWVGLGTPPTPKK